MLVELDPTEDYCLNGIVKGTSMVVNSRWYTVEEVTYRSRMYLPAQRDVRSNIDFQVIGNNNKHTYWDGGSCRIALTRAGRFRRYLHLYPQKGTWNITGWVWRKHGTKSVQVTDLNKSLQEVKVEVEHESCLGCGIFFQCYLKTCPSCSKLRFDPFAHFEGKCGFCGNKDQTCRCETTPNELRMICNCGSRYKRIGKMLWCPNCKQHF